MADDNTRAGSPNSKKIDAYETDAAVRAFAELKVRNSPNAFLSERRAAGDALRGAVVQAARSMGMKVDERPAGSGEWLFVFHDKGTMLDGEVGEFSVGRERVPLVYDPIDKLFWAEGVTVNDAPEVRAASAPTALARAICEALKKQGL